MSAVKYVKTLTESVKAVRDILVKEKPVIGVKCFGCNVGEQGGRITLISVGCWDGHIYVFDLMANKEIMYGGGLNRLFQCAELLKVFHDCATASATLLKQFGVKLRNFYDTQVAYSVVMERKGLSPRLLSFIQLCDVYRLVVHTPSCHLQRLLAEDVNVWARRPCTRDMLLVAASCVQPLVPALFTETDSMLPPATDEWFMHRCEETRLARMKSSTLKCGQKIKCSRGHSCGIEHLFGTHFCLCPSCVCNMNTAQNYHQIGGGNAV